MCVLVVERAVIMDTATAAGAMTDLPARDASRDTMESLANVSTGQLTQSNMSLQNRRILLLAVSNCKVSFSLSVETT